MSLIKLESVTYDRAVYINPANVVTVSSSGASTLIRFVGENSEIFVKESLEEVISLINIQIA